MNHAEPLLYTPEQAARAMGGSFTASWLIGRARKGKFPCTMSGRKRMFSNANLLEIIAICEVRPAVDPIEPSVAERFTAWSEDETGSTLEDAFVAGFAQGMEWARTGQRNRIEGVDLGAEL